MGNKTVRYADDKPKDCKYCYFWGSRVKNCTLGGVENCHYLITEVEALAEKTKCDDCRYKKCGPCIGWCTKDVYRRRETTEVCRRCFVSQCKHIH